MSDSHLTSTPSSSQPEVTNRTILDDSINRCPRCHSSVKDNQPGLACGICRNWVHVKCDPLISIGLYRSLVKHSADSLVYLCPCCKETRNTQSISHCPLPLPDTTLISPRWTDGKAHKRALTPIPNSPKMNGRTTDNGTQTDTLQTIDKATDVGTDLPQAKSISTYTQTDKDPRDPSQNNDPNLTLKPKKTHNKKVHPHPDPNRFLVLYILPPNHPQDWLLT